SNQEEKLPAGVFPEGQHDTFDDNEGCFEALMHRRMLIAPCAQHDDVLSRRRQSVVVGRMM
ncbi:MAG: hypothetical protein ACR2IT_02615, partial [Pirellulales bacterium]